MKKSLVFLSSEVYGGPHNELCNLNRYLSENDWKIEVVIPEENLYCKRRLEAANINVHVLPFKRLQTSPIKIFKYLFDLRKQMRYFRVLIRRIEPDVVQIYNFSNLEVSYIANQFNVPILWKLVDSRFPKHLGKWLVQILKHKINVIMTTGRNLGFEHFGLKVDDNWFYYYPVFDNENSEIVRPREYLRSILGVSSTQILIGSLANFNKQKNQEAIVRNYNKIFGNDEKFALRLRGNSTKSNNYLKRLEKLLKNMEMPREVIGGLENIMTPKEFLSILDFHVIASSSRSEGFPNVIAECIGVKTVIISTAVGSIADLIENFQSGILMAPNRISKELAKIFCSIKSGRLNLNKMKKDFDFKEGISTLIDDNYRIHVRALNLASDRVINN